MHNYTCTELDLLVFKVKNLEENNQDEYAHILLKSIILLGIRIITVEFLFSPESCWWRALTPEITSHDNADLV